MNLQTNPQLELALEYVNFTNANIFLTGRAGTGKTTFLHQIRKDSPKRMAVVAPTGVAAINAGGMTIHSLFQLPFGPFLPGNKQDPSRQRRFSSDKIRLLRSLDLLVIDEISMVRADLLDGIDDVLRRYRDFTKPFGGVQLLMIGDLHQLPPVARDDDWSLLRNYYATPYFFSSQALQKTAPVVIELQHIYRQSDTVFIDLLNKVRDRRIDAEVLETLNQRYTPGFQPAEDEGYITLSTHNATAQEINAEKLRETKGKLHQFKAEITGDFPAHAYPTDEALQIKVGAQVMFVKNDGSRDKLFYNGKIGKVTAINDDIIQVQCPDEHSPISVGPVLWENIKYSLNEKNKEVGEEVIGMFKQHPLKLAWAITIHKSQGLTFERVILDAQAAFAHGQVYVALSRCRSFEGIVLRTPIQNNSIRTDAIVQDFSQEAAKNAPTEAQLEAAKAMYQQSLLLELFGMAGLKKRTEQTQRILLEHEGSLHPEARLQFGQLKDQIWDMLPVADKFRQQLMFLFSAGGLPEKNAEVLERLRKAGAWFAEKTGADLLPASRDIRILTDNKELQKSAEEALEAVQEELYVCHACFNILQRGFEANAFLRTKANAALDFKAEKTKSKTSNSAIPQDLPHPALFSQLMKWRNDTAADFEMEAYMVMPTKVLVELVKHLPQTQAGLLAIKGLGNVKVKAFGADLLGMIQTYCSTHNITPDDAVVLPGMTEKPEKKDTKTLSFEMFQAGKSIDEIAETRGFVRSTIENHLSHFVGTGALDIQAIIPREVVTAIEAYYRDHPEALSSEVKAFFEDKYSYGEIRMVRAWMA
ncbi:MAG: helix-turn-helix domain-containing protein [Lewinellaceae bacterium]|nr:helix-turn-helix domain-containing protein [Lewinellaceae bacterium]